MECGGKRSATPLSTQYSHPVWSQSGVALNLLCSLHASDASEADSRSHTRFPLTPTLSLGERERPCARVRRLRQRWFVERSEMVLPLPKA